MTGWIVLKFCFLIGRWKVGGHKLGSLSNRTYDGDGDVEGIARWRHNRKTIAVSSLEQLSSQGAVLDVDIGRWKYRFNVLPKRCFCEYVSSRAWLIDWFCVSFHPTVTFFFEKVENPRKIYELSLFLNLMLVEIEFIDVVRVILVE